MNDLEWPFQGHDYSTITRKWYNSWPIESVYDFERRHFQWPWTTPTPSFKVTPFFDVEYLRNGTRYRHSSNKILIGTYTRPTPQCHFDRPWVTLGELAKYSRSVAWSLRQLSFLFIWSSSSSSFYYWDQFSPSTNTVSVFKHMFPAHNLIRSVTDYTV